jgi:hypothetical protein
MIVLSTVEQFGAAIVELFADRERISVLGRAARALAIEHFSSAVAFGPLAGRLEELAATAPELC